MQHNLLYSALLALILLDSISCLEALYKMFSKRTLSAPAKKKKKALTGFEPVISCLLDRRFNQLSHRACSFVVEIIWILYCF